MSNNNFRDVGDFHAKFGLHSVTDRGPYQMPIDPDLLDFRVKFMQEELDEYKEGMAEGDHAKMFDALLDLAYVVLGTAHLSGYPWQEGWNLVQEANMAKVRAAPDGSDSKRGSSFDVVKPPGWMPPDIEMLLMDHGWRKYAKVILFKESGKYYTEEPWEIPTIEEIEADGGSRGDQYYPGCMKYSKDARKIGNGYALVETQEPWGHPAIISAKDLP